MKSNADKHGMKSAAKRELHEHHDHHAHMAADFRKRFWISQVIDLVKQAQETKSETQNLASSEMKLPVENFKSITSKGAESRVEAKRSRWRVLATCANRTSRSKTGASSHCKPKARRSDLCLWTGS
jgi:hypothetical protein